MATKALYVKLHVRILTKKIPGKNDSIFYAGKDIAEVRVGESTYVLSAIGHYSFSVDEDSDSISFDSGDKVPRIVRTLTDAKIDNMSTSNWGWFTIRVWHGEGDNCKVDSTDKVYSKYTEALRGLVDYMKCTLSN